MIGEATNNEEYVPTITPTINANINPRITSPPNKNITNKTKNVVKEVLTVLLNVLFNALFTNGGKFFFLVNVHMFPDSVKYNNSIIQRISNDC